MLNLLALLVGYVVSIFVGSVVVEWCLHLALGEDDREFIAGFERRGLEHGPLVMGWLERFLITTFVLAGSYAAVGLVLASKAVVRYPEMRDARNQRVAEYVFIETMLSLAWALLVSVAVLNFTA